MIANLANAEILGILRVHAPHVHPQQIGRSATIMAHVASEDHRRFIFGFRFLTRLRSGVEAMWKSNVQARESHFVMGVTVVEIANRNFH